MKRDWDKIYLEKGVVQKGVLPLVEEASLLFKREGVVRVLDLGCGTGRHLAYFAGMGFTVYGVDVSEKALEMAKDFLSSEGFSGVVLKKADMRSLPYEDNFFDAVVATWVINHALMKDIAVAVREIRRVLNSGGFVVLKNLSVNDYNFGVRPELEPGTFLGDEEGEEDVPHHFFTEKELRSLFSGFKVVKLKEVSHVSERSGKMRMSFDLIARKK